MMKKIAILFGVASIFASCNTTSENTMRINANLEGMEDQVVYLSNSRKLEPIDSCEMKDGKFSFDVKFDMPNVKYLFIKQKTRRGDNYSSTMIFVEPGTLNIAGVRDESGLYKAQMSGTISNELWQEVSKINYTECTLKERPIREKLSEASARLNKANNEKLKNEIQAEINDLKAQLNKIYLDSDKLINELVNKNISTFFAAFYIMDSNYELRNSIEKSDSILKVFEAAGMPNNQAVETIKSRLEILKKTAPGMPAIDFTLKTIDGKDFNLLTEMKGKVFVIDFWASWCGPCRRENPHMVETYAKYKDMGFDAVSVSLDKDAEAWKKAVADDKLVWHQVIDDINNKEKSVSKQYGVSSIPTIFLVDREGKIVARGLRGDDLSKKIGELLNQ